MAFFGRVGNILRHAANRKIGSELCSLPSVFQATRCTWNSPNSKLFIGGVSHSIDEQSLREVFSKYGEVVAARIIVDRETGRSKGFGFITYSTVEGASSAIQALDGQDLHGRQVSIKFATEKPRGFGGSGGNFDGSYGNTSYGTGYPGGYGNSPYGAASSTGGYGDAGAGGYGGNVSSGGRYGDAGGYGGGGYGLGGNSGGRSSGNDYAAAYNTRSADRSYGGIIGMDHGNGGSYASGSGMNHGNDGRFPSGNTYNGGTRGGYGVTMGIMVLLWMVEKVILLTMVVLLLVLVVMVAMVLLLDLARVIIMTVLLDLVVVITIIVLLMVVPAITLQVVNTLEAPWGMAVAAAQVPVATLLADAAAVINPAAT